MDSKLLILIVFLLAVAVGVLAIYENANNSLNNNQNVSSQNSSSDDNNGGVLSGNVTGAGAYVKISYPGALSGTVKSAVNGTIQVNGNTETFKNVTVYINYISNSGDQIYSVMGNLLGIEVSVSKADNGTAPLKVELIENGTVVDNKTITGTNGTILLKYGAELPATP